MGNQSQAVPARGRSAMLFRRARSGLFLIALFWAWMLFGAADFIAALFDSPAYAALALLMLGALTLISLLFLPICVAYLVLHRPQVPGRAGSGTASRSQSRETHPAGLAPVVRMAPPRGSSAKPASRAAAKRRDVAS